MPLPPRRPPVRIKRTRPAVRIERPVEVVCLDVDGTLRLGLDGPLVPGAAATVTALRRRFPVRLVTNTTSRSHARLARELAGVGLLAAPGELVTPAASARRVLESRGHTHGILLADPGSREDLAWFREDAATGDGAAVVVATEGHELQIADLQPAFRALLDGAALYALQRNRYFRLASGTLVADLGPLVAYLEYASGREAETLGKPSRLLFEAIAAETGTALEHLLMAGDDAEFDAAGSAALGMTGVLVRTGKYRPGDEERVRPRPTAVLDSVVQLPAALGV